MNSYTNLCLALLVCIISVLQTGESIECYNCQSETDSDCDAGAPDERYLKNCSTLKTGPKYVACRKIENWVDFKVLDQEPTKRIIRQCAADVVPGRACYYRAGFGGRANVCDCFDSKCNDAPALITSIMSTILCFGVLFIFL